MNMATIKLFICWLECADRGEIIQKRREFEETLAEVRSREARADLRLGLRLIDEELLARMELGHSVASGTGVSRPRRFSRAALAGS